MEMRREWRRQWSWKEKSHLHTLRYQTHLNLGPVSHRSPVNGDEEQTAGNFAATPNTIPDWEQIKMQMQHFNFSRFHLQDKWRTSVLFTTLRCVRACACLHVCVFMDECVYLFVCQVWNERRQLGDWRWGCINRLDSEASSLSCISIIMSLPLSLLATDSKIANVFFFSFLFCLMGIFLNNETCILNAIITSTGENWLKNYPKIILIFIISNESFHLNSRVVSTPFPLFDLTSLNFLCAECHAGICIFTICSCK